MAEPRFEDAMADTFAASCFLAAAPGSRPCTVAVAARWLEICPDAGSAVRWRYEALVGEITGDERTWLTLACREPVEGGVTAVVIRDPAFAAEVAARVDEPCRRVLDAFAGSARGHAARQRGAFMLATLGLALAVVVGWWSCTRLAPEIAAEALSPAAETRLGTLLLEGLLAGERRIGDGPAHRALERIVARLAAAADDSRYSFSVHLVDDPRVNAVALPGGQIVVFTGLLAAAGSAEEVAGVLAHEIQHVLHRHGLRQLVRQLGGAAVIALSTGGGDLAGLAGRADDLVRLSYGREQEAEADRDGLALLHRAGLRPAAMAEFFSRLQRLSPGGMPEFLSTHPETARRIAALRHAAAALPPVSSEPLDIDWDAVRGGLD